MAEPEIAPYRPTGLRFAEIAPILEVSVPRPSFEGLIAKRTPDVCVDRDAIFNLGTQNAGLIALPNNEECSKKRRPRRLDRRHPPLMERQVTRVFALDLSGIGDQEQD